MQTTPHLYKIVGLHGYMQTTPQLYKIVGSNYQSKVEQNKPLILLTSHFVPPSILLDTDYNFRKREEMSKITWILNI